MLGNTSHFSFLLAELQIHPEYNVPTPGSPFIWTNLENPFLQVSKLPCSQRSSCDTFGKKWSNGKSAMWSPGNLCFLIKSGVIRQALPLSLSFHLGCRCEVRDHCSPLMSMRWSAWGKGQEIQPCPFESLEPTSKTTFSLHTFICLKLCGQVFYYLWSNTHQLI